MFDYSDYECFSLVMLLISSCIFLGTNVEEARKILANSGLAITAATDLNDAATKAVASLKKK